MREPRASAGLYVVLALASLAAAQVLPAAQSGKPPVVRVTTRLVQINAIVKDRHGEPVRGLKREDFSVFDNGRPQTITVFGMVESPSTVEFPAAEPPGVFSNEAERKSGFAPAVTVILFDGLNTAWEDQLWARLQVLKFLQQIQPDDHVALYALGRRLEILHDFTTDPQQLLQALAKYRERIATELDASDPSKPLIPDDLGSVFASREAASLTAWMRRSAELVKQYYLDRRVEITADALVSIAQHLARVPGRKNLVWVSSAFPLTWGLTKIRDPGGVDSLYHYGPTVLRVSQALNDANLAMYPVDARGLMVDPRYTSLSKPPEPFFKMRDPIQRALDPNYMTDYSTAEEFASLTGGRAFYNTNDIQGAIRRVVDDSRLTYAIGYYPDHGRWDGRYRHIKLVVDRPGVHLEFRKGYVALPEPPPSSMTAEQALSAVAFNPLDATGIGLTVSALSLEAGRAPGQIRARIVVDAHDLALEPVDNRWKGHVTLVLVEVGPKGEKLQGVAQAFSFQLRPEERESLIAKGLDVTGTIAFAPSAEQLRVAVCDDESGAMGSVSIPISQIVHK